MDLHRFRFVVARFSSTAGLSTTYANCSRRIWRSRFLGFSDFFFYRRCASALFWFASRPVPADLAKNGSASSNPFASPLDRNAPQLPGTVTHEPDFRAPASQNQNSPRSLDAVNVVPAVIPGEGQPELLGDLGLSSYSFDVEAIRRDFLFCVSRSTPSTDLAGQWRNHAEAAIGHRPAELFLRARKLERASRRA